MIDPADATASQQIKIIGTIKKHFLQGSRSLTKASLRRGKQTGYYTVKCLPISVRIRNSEELDIGLRVEEASNDQGEYLSIFIQA